MSKKKIVYIKKSDAIGCAELEGAYKAMMLISDLPAEDVRPFKRGHWINDGDCMICSYCHKAYSSWFNGSNYCSVCGTYMRGGEKNENDKN